MYLNRAISDVLLKRVKESKCVLVTGARQVGKSTLLKKVFKDYNYITFDDISQIAKAKEDAKLFFKNNEPPLILDEVQELPEIFKNIKILCDESDKRGQFLLTGSQLFELSRLSGESLAGRVSILELNTLSLREKYNIDFNKPFLPNDDYFEERKNKVCEYKNIWQDIFLGGFPELITVSKERDDFFASYVKTYIQRDIYSIAKIKDFISFNKFLVAIAARVGQLLNYSNLAEDVGVSVPTIKEWTGYLERSGVIFLLQPYFSNILKRAIKTPKIYFFDTGLAAYLTKWSSADTLERSYISGNFFENFVISEIVKTYINSGKDYHFNLFYYRGKDKIAIDSNSQYGSKKEIEIDLIIESDNILYPVEIKKTSSPTKEMAKAFSVLSKEVQKKVGRGVILCQCDKKYYLDDNLIALPIDYI